MRWMIGIALLLAVGLWVACIIELPTDSGYTKAMPVAWRLTPTGWQKTSSFKLHLISNHAEEVQPLELPHPVVLSLFVILLSLFALVAFSPSQPSSSFRTNEQGQRPKFSQVELRSEAWLNG